MSAARIKDSSIPPESCFTLKGPGGYEDPNCNEDGDPFGDIPSFHKEGDGKTKYLDAHGDIRSWVLINNMRKAIIEEVEEKKTLTMAEGAHVARGFLALQREFLKKKTPASQYSKVGT